MLIKVIHIQFHDDVFHAGKNFGKKIEISKVDGLKIEFDEDNRRFYMTYKNRIRVFPELSAFSWEDEQNSPEPILEIKNEHRTEDRSKRVSAQVSTPMGHVFEGPGKGKTK